jgi:hypothetical protein
MSQLTALQLAIKKFKSESNLSWESGSYTDAHAYDYVVQELTKLLENEKEQMIEFAQEVFRNRYNQISQSLGNIADDIYNETYKNK